MSPDFQLDAAQEWLLFAKSDLALAEAGQIPGVRLETLCFHAQQAVEKSIKAVLLVEGVEFPGTHNIRVLLDRIPEGIVVPVQSLPAAELSIYAVNNRYPGNYEATTVEQYRDACEIARVFVDWAAKRIG